MTAAQLSAHEFAQQLYRDRSTVHHGVVEATQPGLIAGTAFVDPCSAPADAGRWQVKVRDGDFVEPGQVLVEVSGNAASLVVAEDYILGSLGFASGIATRAKAVRDQAPAGLAIACGGWKKLPPALKPLIRAGLDAAGVNPRLIAGNFVYLAKNSVIMLGGVERAIAAGLRMNNGPVAIQVRNADEAIAAANMGAGVVMVDTGNLEDLDTVHRALVALGMRQRVKVAFAGGVRVEDLRRAASLGAEAVDMGRAILDAPILDLRMRVVL